MEVATRNTFLRTLASVDELLSRPSLASLISSQPRPLVVEALRTAVETARARLLAGGPVGFDEADVHFALESLKQRNLRRVIKTRAAAGGAAHVGKRRTTLRRVAAGR